MKCNVCDHEEPDDGIGVQKAIDHVRVMHPEAFEEPERWPDGGLVIEDTTLDPSDFTPPTKGGA